MFINVGFGNFINSKQIVSISRADSAPMKRLITGAREQGNIIDSTQGRRTKSVVVSTSGHVILSALLPETLAGRYKGTEEENDGYLERGLAEDEAEG